jgi:phosphomannomutase
VQRSFVVTPSAAVNSSTVYFCPGEEKPIERAVHLGRLAAFYPVCARCPHRTDSGMISPQRVQKLERLAQHSESGDSLFGPEGISGVYRNELDAAAARRVGQALGLHLSSRPAPIGEKTDPPIVLLAGDGQTVAAELAAAAADGLRWAGCEVVDCGAATAASMLASFERLAATGALLVGNPEGRAGHVGLTMWGPGGLPLSAGGELDQVRRICETSSLPRPSRPAGGFARESIEGPYLSDLAEFYHALRPLRVVIETSSPVLHRYLESLVSRVAIELAPNNEQSLPAMDDSQRLGRIASSVRRCGAHLGVWIDGYGERCCVVD